MFLEVLGFEGERRVRTTHEEGVYKKSASLEGKRKSGRAKWGRNLAI